MGLDDGWRKRLEDALAKSERSARDVSLKAGASPGYLHGLLYEDKEPTLGNLVAICDELKIAISWLVYGIEMDAETDRLLRLFSRLSSDQKADFLRLAESAASLAGRKKD